MKILFLGKYPPLVGESSSQGYFIVQDLINSGNEVYIVTEGWSFDKDYRDLVESTDFELLNNKQAQLYSIDPLQEKVFMGSSRITELVTLSLQIFEKNEFDCILCNSIDPYGIAAYLVKTITGKPLVLNDTNESIEAYVFNPQSRKCVEHVISNVDLALCSFGHINLYKTLGAKNIKKLVPLYLLKDSNNADSYNTLNNINNNEFIKMMNAKIDSSLKTIILLGDASYAQNFRYWIKQLELVKHEFNLVVCCYGTCLERLKELISRSFLSKNTLFIPTLSPWYKQILINFSDICIHTSMLNDSRNIDKNFVLSVMANSGVTVIPNTELNIVRPVSLDNNNCLVGEDTIDIINNALGSNIDFKNIGVNAKAEYLKHINNYNVASLIKEVL